MKKVLEDELMSLAHRILKLRNRAEIHELKEQAAVLYEKLSVLSFAEKHFDGLKPTIKKHDVEKSIEADHYHTENESNYPDGTEYNAEQIYEHNTEKIKDIVSQMPYESTQVDKMFEDNNNEEKHTKTENLPEDEIQDFGVHFDDLPDFEPAQENSNDQDEQKPEPEPETDTDTEADAKHEKEPRSDEGNSNMDETENKKDEKPQRTMDLFSQQKKSLNDSLNKDLKIGLNDRLSFIMHLFKGDKQSYEVFLVEINNLDSFEKVKAFLDEQIKNKYEFWKDNEDIANRLLYLIEKKFE